jgi:hypothetical protein
MDRNGLQNQSIVFLQEVYHFHAIAGTQRAGSYREQKREPSLDIPKMEQNASDPLQEMFLISTMHDIELQLWVTLRIFGDKRVSLDKQ